MKNPLGQIVIAILAVVAFAWFMQMGKAPVHILVRRDCENRYAQARTRADTLVVDHFVPPLEQPRDTLSATCGALRGAGSLR